MYNPRSSPENRLGVPADTVVDQLLCDPKVHHLLHGFEEATGINLRLARWELPGPADAKQYVGGHAFPFCQRFLNSSPAAMQHCIQVHSRLRVATESGPARVRCAPGLLHAAVAIFVHGEAIGFLVVFGIATDSDADSHALAEFHDILASNAETGNEGGTAALLRSLEEIERHPASWVDGVLRLMETMAYWIQDHAVHLVPQRTLILPAPLARAVEFGKKHHAYEMLTMAQVAEEAGVTPQRLAQLFRGIMGEPFTAWLARYRVSRAKERLRTGRERILDIALACGFGALSSFNRSFQKFTGITPSKYRAGCEPGPGPDSRP